MNLNEPYAAPIRKGPPRQQDAIPPIPANANAYDIASEDEIGDMLTDLAASGEAISMYGTGSREVVLGRILSVDPKLPHFVMELNDGASLPPGKVTFVASLPSAKLQFRLANPEWRTVPGKPHLVPMTFPENCAVLNRRTSGRQEPPVGTSFMASFVSNGKPYEMSIYDLSPGGIGVRCAKLDAKGMLKGRRMRDVVLDLGAETIHVPELEIRYTRPYRSFLLGEQLHLGCMFVNLAPEERAKIQGVLEKIGNASRRR